MKSKFRTMTRRRPGRAALPARIAMLVILAILSILAILALFAGARQSLRTALTLRSAWPPEADTLGLPPVAMLRFLSLGHREMAADLVAARANVYFAAPRCSCTTAGPSQ